MGTITIQNNYAFIDGHNFHLTFSKVGWKLDYKKFRKYLYEEYGVTKAYIFLGFRIENRFIYRFLEKVGFVLVFKEAVKKTDGTYKANCDVELTMKVCLEFWNFDKAIIVSSDGDFLPLIQILMSVDKLEKIIVSHKEGCSFLYFQYVSEHLHFLDKEKEFLQLQ